MEREEVIIVGGGQSGLATAYYLRRYGIPFSILDDHPEPGGAWRETWDSLRLFSPASASSLPGWPMPESEEAYPTREEVIEYLRAYEMRYGFPVERPVHVKRVATDREGFRVFTDRGERRSRCLIAATGTWSHPHIPEYPGRQSFEGQQLHSAYYRDPRAFEGKRVAVVGGGNSGAQLLAELSKVAETLWITRQPPSFLPDHVDGRQLFEEASKLYKARKKGKQEEPSSVFDLGSIVMVPSVKEARDRGVLKAVRPFDRIEADRLVWEDGSTFRTDAILWCTGFEPALGPFRELDIYDEEGKVLLERNASERIPGLYFVGYGHWTGYASATLIGVGRTAQRVAQQVRDVVQSER